MRLLAKTLRDSKDIGNMVLSLKLPHTIRDAANADLSRAVRVCPNLRFVDLGKAFFAGDSQFDILRLELWMNCPDLRTMTYMHGAERYFSALSADRWTNLETVTIIKLHVDAIHLRVVLSHLKNLETLHLEEIPKLNDDLFVRRYDVPSIPAIEDLQLYSLPFLTSKGLVAYLEDPATKRSLRRLTLSETGVGVATIHEVLTAAPRLTYLGIVDTVTEPLPMALPPYLCSRKLERLHFEINDPAPEFGGDTQTVTESPPSDSHYKYLLASISMRGLPALRSLYVRDPSFPEDLARLQNLHLQAPPEPQSRPVSAEPVSSPWGPPPSTNPFLQSAPMALPKDNQTMMKPLGKFVESSGDESMGAIAEKAEDGSDDDVMESPHPLEVFTRSQDEDQWLFVRTVTHSTFHRSHHGHRPVSTMSDEWTGIARRSVLLPDGVGGFLAEPDA
jgi:hypothetical protein